jgi:hypothetical protein
MDFTVFFPEFMAETQAGSDGSIQGEDVTISGKAVRCILQCCSVFRSIIDFQIRPDCKSVLCAGSAVTAENRH